MSIGRLVEDLGFKFEWERGRRPKLSRGGIEFELTVKNYVPYLDVSDAENALAATTPAAKPVEPVPEVPEAFAEPDTDDDEIAVIFGNTEKRKKEAL